MSDPSRDTKSESMSEPVEPSIPEPMERLFKKRKITTVSGVGLVSAQYGVAGIPLLVQALSAPSLNTRKAAFETLRGFGDPAFRHLLRTATEGKGDQRLAAVTHLGEWGDPRALDALILAIRRDRGDRTRKKVGTIALVSLVVIGILVLLALLTDGGICCADCGDCGCFACETSDDVRLRVEATKSLIRLGDLRAVGALAQLAQDRDREVAKSGHDALMALLRKGDSLQEGSADVLGPDGLTELAALLPRNDYFLTQAILQVFRKVGDGRILSAVEKLAQDYTRSRDLREEARELLPILKQRIAREEARTTLLRAADGEAGYSSENLLRPVTGQRTMEPPDQLLRAKDPE